MAGEPLIYQHEGLLSQDQCRYVMRYLDKHWDKGVRSQIYGGRIDPRRNSQSFPITRDQRHGAMDRFLCGRVSHLIKGYVDWLPPECRCDGHPMHDEGHTGVVYRKGGLYETHHDDGGQDVFRRISGLIYLNDDYGAGELWFPHQKVTLKPKAGTGVCFPSGFEYPHRCNVITTGRKCIITTWFR